MTSIFSPLLSAIDEQDLAAVKKFMEAHLNLDYNCVTPNKMSALWWVLQPLKEQTISVDIIEYLVNFKANGSAVINPAQQFANMSPLDYVGILKPKELSNQAVSIISTAENAYRAVKKKGIKEMMPNDPQNVHIRAISEPSERNINRLLERYGVTCLNEDSSCEIKQVRGIQLFKAIR